MNPIGSPRCALLSGRVLLPLILLLLWPGTLPRLRGETDGQFVYTKAGFYAYIVGYVGGGGAVGVPPVLFDGSVVIQIAANAFRDRTTVTSVHLADSIPAIGQNAFNGCTNLTSVHLPASLGAIPDSCFYGCTRLTTVEMPANLGAIGQSSFQYCSALASITLPAHLTTLGTSAFAYCTSLAACAIPDTVTTLSAAVFANCGSLTSVTLPANLEVLPELLFYDCKSLPAVSLPSTVERILDYPFSGCSALTSLSLPASVTSIRIGPCPRCTALTTITVAAGNPSFVSVDGVLFSKSLDRLVQYPVGRSGGYRIPAAVKTIGHSAFYGGAGLTDLRLPSGLIGIDPSAFSYCTGLQTVTIPASVTQVAAEAFSSCTGLHTAVFEGNAPSLSDPVFEAAAPGFTIYCYTGSTGFTTPTWHTYTTRRIARLVTSSFSRGGGSVTVQAVGGQQGWSYALQSSADCGATPWITVATFGPLPVSGSFQMSGPSASGKTGFYRIAAQAP